MNRARSFFYVSLGILALAAAYHLGASTATAQSGSFVSGFSGEQATSGGGIAAGHYSVMTPNGDVFVRYMYSEGATEPAMFVGNFWAGGPTPAQRESFGQLKARYRGERAAVPQGAQPQRLDRR